MTRQHLRAFVTLLYGLGEAYNHPVSEVAADIYFGALEDLAFDDVRRAVATHVQTSKFFPRPADLRELVLGNTEDQAEIAWRHILREVRRVGWNGTPTWADEPTRRAALDLFGGWRRLCENLPASGPELLGLRKQFGVLYGALKHQATRGELPPSREEASALLDGLKSELTKRGLPSGEL